MFFVIPLILIFGAFGGIGYIVWPKFKEIKKKEDLPEIEQRFWSLMVPELVHFFNFTGSKLKVFKDNAATDYEKFLRRIKIMSLKTHNLTDKLLEKRQKNGIKSEFEFESKEIKDNTNGKTASASFRTRESGFIAEISKNPKDKVFYKSLAALYMESEMYEDAEEVYNVILELDPNDAEAKEELDKIVNLI
jgi:tetratricopeptide (TPR) repeat protein